MLDEVSEYTFESSKEFDDGLANLQEGQVNRVMAFLRDHARFTPTQPIPGQLKELHGTWKGDWEYRVSRSIRLRYWVDEENRVVKLRQLGPHRGWERSRDRMAR